MSELRDALAAALDVIGHDVYGQKAPDPLDRQEEWVATPREMASDLLSDPAFRAALMEAVERAHGGTRGHRAARRGDAVKPLLALLAVASALVAIATLVYVRRPEPEGHFVRWIGFDEQAQRLIDGEDPGLVVSLRTNATGLNVEPWSWTA